MSGDVNEVLTAEDLKGKIFHSIKESGIIDNLKVNYKSFIKFLILT